MIEQRGEYLLVGKGISPVMQGRIAVLIAGCGVGAVLQQQCHRFREVLPGGFLQQAFVIGSWTTLSEQLAGVGIGAGI
jgi:hypothetical protein